MTENKANAISVSLLNRKIYAVCYTGIDTLGAFHGALYTPGGASSKPAKPRACARPASTTARPARCAAR
mgnify:CR=1 FL=1